jgi:hypothetical protein
MAARGVSTRVVIASSSLRTGRALPEGVTQFGRALRELDIELLRAYTPRANRRVERFFGVAEDRWVKELRLEGVQKRS